MLLRIELPYPPPEASPNWRGFWAVKHTAIAIYRDDCGWMGKEAMMNRSHLPGAIAIRAVALRPPVTATVQFVVPTKRRRDEDNALASLKAAWDGLVGAGLLEDDSADKFRVVSAEPLFRVEKGERHVSVTLEAALQ